MEGSGTMWKGKDAGAVRSSWGWAAWKQVGALATGSCRPTAPNPQPVFLTIASSCGHLLP